VWLTDVELRGTVKLGVAEVGNLLVMLGGFEERGGVIVLRVVVVAGTVVVGGSVVGVVVGGSEPVVQMVSCSVLINVA